MEKVFLNKVSLPFKDALHLITEPQNSQTNRSSIIYASSKKVLEIAEISKFRTIRRASHELADDIQVILPLKGFYKAEAENPSQTDPSRPRKIFLILDKNQSLTFVNEQLEEISKLTSESLFDKIAPKAPTSGSNIEPKMSNTRFIFVRSFANQLLLVGHKRLFGLQLSLHSKHSGPEIDLEQAFELALRQSVSCVEVLEKSCSRGNFVYYFVNKNSQSIEVFCNDQQEQSIEFQSSIISMHKPRETLRKDSQAREELLIALRTHSIILVNLEKSDYQIVFSFDVRGTEPIGQICLYNNYDLWGLTVCVERVKRLEIYQEQLSNIYEFKYDICFKDSIVSMQSLLLAGKINSFLILFKSGIFGIIIERSGILSHLSSLIDFTAEMKALKKAQITQKNKQTEFALVKKNFSNPDLFEETLNFQCKLVKPEQIEIILKNDFEPIREVLILKPAASAFVLKNKQSASLVQSDSSSFASLRVDANYALLEMALIDDCVSEVELVVKFDANFITKTVAVPLLYNFELVPRDEVQVPEKANVLELRGKFKPLIFTRILKTLFKISSINEMNLKKNSFNSKVTKAFLLERIEIGESKCVFQVLENKLSLHMVDSRLLRRVEDHLNLLISQKNYELNVVCQYDKDAFAGFKQKVFNEYVSIRQNEQNTKISEMIREMTQNQFLLNGEQFSSFLQGNRTLESNLSQSHLNYNPDKNLSRVLSKSTINQSRVAGPPGLKLDHIKRLLISFSTDTVQTLELIESEEFDERKLKRLIE